MLAANVPSKIQLPFADAGTKNTIPVPSQISITPGAASYTDGFPPLTFLDILAGGIPPDGGDVNGVLYAITAVQQWQCAGGYFRFETALSTAIGGYPKGAILQSTDGLNAWLSLVDDNTDDPDTTPTNWIKIFNSTLGASIASGATVDLRAATGDALHITGTTGISAFTMYSGQKVDIVFDGSLLLTHNATTNNLPSAANITTAAGDRASYWSDGTTVFCTSYTRASGQAVIEPQMLDVDYSMAGNALTLIIKGGQSIQFHSTDQTDGTPVTRFIPTDISTTISSGSTGGTVSAVQSEIVILAIDNAGTVEVAWCNRNAIGLSDSNGLISTTAEGGAGGADSDSVIYSTTARANVSPRIAGVFKSTQAIAGTWVTAPSLIQGAGGMALIPQVMKTGVFASTSGTSKDWAIPAWATHFVVHFAGFSSSGSNDYLIQIGVTTPATSGYLGACSSLTTGVTSQNFTSGFGIISALSGNINHGAVEINHLGNNIYEAHGMVACSNAATTRVTASSVTLAGRADILRLTTVGGIDTFDAGNVSVTFWG